MKKKLIILSTAMLSSKVMLSQSQTETALDNFFQNWLSPILHIIFLILIAIGLIRLISGMVGKDPDVGKRALMLIAAVIVYAAFNLIIGDISTFF